jgi:hypothetical protein
MKKLLLLTFAALTLVACKKDEENGSNSSATNSGSGGGDFGYVAGPEGGEIVVTYPDGTSEELAVTSIIGWDGGNLLNYNYWKQIRLGTEMGTFFLRYNLLQEHDWQTEVQGLNEFYNFPFLLQYSQDMDDKIVELYCPSCDDIEGNASGQVNLTTNVPTPSGTYDVIGTFFAEFTEFGQTIEVSGTFWAEELN